MDAHDRIWIHKSFESKDLEQFANQFCKRLTPEAVHYLESRGIAPTTIEELKIGYQPAKIGFSGDSNPVSDFFENRIIIPIRNTEGTIVDLAGRTIDHREPKYKLLLGNEEVFFNEPALVDAEDVILCNSIFDVLVLYQERIPAICLQSVVGFKATHAIHLHGKRVMVCLGNDEVGMRESIRIEALLHEADIESYIVHLPENVRDIHDFFLRAEEPLQQFVVLLNQTIEQAMIEPVASDFRNVTVYLEEYMKRFRGLVSGVSTGFAALDQALLGGFRPGLYLLTGTSSSGKSMLLKQIADQMAHQQVPVIYVSYDLSAFELWSRSIARILGVEPSDVLNGHINPDMIHEANQTYASLSQHLWTLEMPMDSTLSYMISLIEKIIMSLGRMPVVMIDHLEKILYSEQVEGIKSIAQYQTLLTYRFKECSRDWHCPLICSLPLAEPHAKLPVGMEVAADVIMEVVAAPASAAKTADALNQPNPAHSKNGDAQRVTIDLHKHKNGGLRVVDLLFYRTRAAFSDL